MSRTFSSVYKNNYSSDYVDILKMKCTKTCAINNYPIDNDSIYLKITDAALTYLTINDAAAEFANYLKITDAALTYLTINDAAAEFANYLTIIDASSTYLSRIGVATSIADSTSFNGGDIFIQGIRAGVGNYISTQDVSLNTCFGKNCLMNTNSLSLKNSAFGTNALKAAISTNGTCAFGNGSLEAVITGDGNTAIGANALKKLTGYVNNSIRNTAVGSNALGNIVTGSKNAVFGDGAGLDISSSTCNENTLIGYLANGNSSGGSYNTFIGSSASETVGGVSSSTALGAYSVTGAYYSTALGAYSTSNHQFSTAIGGGSGLLSPLVPGATTTANHQIMLGTSAETVVCPGTDASGSLILYGGLTLQTAYLTAPASTMLGFQLSNVASPFVITSFTTATQANISAGIVLTAGIWSINYTIELAITGGTATVSEQTLFCSLISAGVYAQRIYNSGITRIYSTNNYLVVDTPAFSGSFSYYTSTGTTVYPIFEITFTGIGVTISGTGYYTATRIG